MSLASPVVALGDGVEIPQLGFGVFQIPPETTADTVLAALQAGYRHIDTAQAYGNEAGVGEAIERSGIDPAEVFVTTKLANAHISYDDARRAVDASLAAIRVKTPDLFLIHWPLPTVRDYTVVWRALVDARRDGLTRVIGVSNFQPAHLDRLAEVSDVRPAVNQIELHPYLAQPGLRAYDRAHGIATEAWSPLAQGAVLGDPVVAEVAAEVGRTAAQVVLRWHLQLGNIVFPKASSADRIRENAAVFDFALSQPQLDAISRLDRAQRIGSDPDTFRAMW